MDTNGRLEEPIPKNVHNARLDIGIKNEKRIMNKNKFISFERKHIYQLLGFAGVYSIENKETENIYVGSSVIIEDRLNTHYRQLFDNKHRIEQMQKDFNKYGIESFIPRIHYLINFITDKKNPKAKLLMIRAYELELLAEQLELRGEEKIYNKSIQEMNDSHILDDLSSFGYPTLEKRMENHIINQNNINDELKESIKELKQLLLNINNK